MISRSMIREGVSMISKPRIREGVSMITEGQGRGEHDQSVNDQEGVGVNS